MRRRTAPSDLSGRPVMARRPLMLLALLAAIAGPCGAQSGDAADPAQAVGRIGIDQRLDAQVPLDLTFTDSGGGEVALREVFSRKRPVVLALVYYECPMLCNLVLNGLLRTLRVLAFDAGAEFDVLTVSFDPLETAELAARKKASCLEQYGRAPETASSGWRFLTGEPPAIDALTRAVGFRYTYDPETDEYAHSSGLVVLTPNGRVSRYFYGVEYSARDLRLALVDASTERIGSPVDELLLLCLRYDPTTGRYGLVIMNVLRAAGILTVLGIAAFVVLMVRRDRRRAPVPHGGPVSLS